MVADSTTREVDTTNVVVTITTEVVVVVTDRTIIITTITTTKEDTITSTTVIEVVDQIKVPSIGTQREERDGKIMIFTVSLGLTSN